MKLNNKIITNYTYEISKNFQVFKSKNIIQNNKVKKVIVYSLILKNIFF